MASPIARDLCARADVLLENFRPGTMARLGLGYAAPRRSNPRLVYCSVSGFGHTGPKAGSGAYDVIIQAVSGLMCLTGPEGGPPVRVGASLGDLVPGPLRRRRGPRRPLPRERTGQGSVPGHRHAGRRRLGGGERHRPRLGDRGRPQPLGSRHPAIAPFAAFPTADGDIALAAGNDALFVRLCTVLGAPELARNRRFLTNSAPRRARRRPDRRDLRASWRRARRRSGCRCWSGAGIPCGLSPASATCWPTSTSSARRMILPLDQPGVGALPVPGIPIKAAGSDDSLPGPAPAFGQHGRAVAVDLLGYSDAAVDRLIADGALLT